MQAQSTAGPLGLGGDVKCAGCRKALNASEVRPLIGIRLEIVTEEHAFGLSGTTGGGTGANPRVSTISEIVPDGVASVSIEYGPARFQTQPGEPAPPHTSTGPYPATTITTKPVANVLAVRLNRGYGGDVPRDQIWRAADGRTLRDISGP